MFRHLMPILTICLCCLSGIAQDKTIALSKSKCGNNLQIKQNSNKRFSANVNFDAIRIENKSSKNGDFCELTIDGTYKTGDEGEPELPALRKLVQVPHGCQFKVRTRCADTAVYNLSDYGIEKQIFPHQRSYTKDVDPNSQKIKKNRKAYKRNTFNTQNLIQVERIGTLRGIDLCQITVNPVRYNPAQNTIQVFNDIDIDIDFTKATSAKSTSNTASPYFEPIFNSIANYKSTSSDLTKYPVKYLIVTHPDFVDALSDFIFWKTQKGFDVVVATTDTIGSSASEIKKWIAAQYASSSPAPSFLLLCADTDKIPCAKTGASSKYGTDLYYACMDGDDDIIPDMYYGRFSARTAEQMKAIADKTVTYEKYQFEDPSYLAKATMIAGYDRTWRSSVGIPTVKYITDNRINASNGYKNVNKFTTNYSGCYEDSTVSVGLMTYTAHGDITYWIDPKLTQTEVNQFGNYGKFPFVIANCCLSGQISAKECLGETWIRRENSGAVAYIGSSPRTYWYEDFYWAVGAHNYRSGVCPKVEETTIGAYDAPFVSDFVCGDAMLFAGNLAVTEAHDNSYPSDISTQYYWEGYNYLGDPSLLVYFGEGKENIVTHEIAHALSDNTLEIYALEGSYVAISKKGTLIDAKTVGAGCNCAILDISSITETCQCDIVVTKARYKPYIGNIEIITPNQPHIVVTKATLDKSVINGDTPRLSLVLKNVGLVPATNSTIKIESKSPFVRKITMSTSSIKDLNYQEDCVIDSICSIELADNIADQTKIALDITITSGDFTFSHTFTFFVNAPVIQLNDYATIKNAIGVLMPGETSNLEIGISNTGHQFMETADIKIIPDEGMDFITFGSNNLTITNIEAYSQTTCQFSISADKNTDLLTPFSFSVIATYMGNVSISDTAHYSMVIGKAHEMQIGNGNIVATYPFNNYYLCGKNQIIYTANDLGGKPIQLKGISFNVKQTISPKEFDGYTNLTIKIKKTDNNKISKYFDMNNAQVVYKSDLYSIPKAGITTFEFDSAFNYDGKSNIVVEIIWGENSKYVAKEQRTSVYCHQTNTATIGYDFEDDMDDIYFYKSTNERPNTTFLYLTPKWIFFTVTDEEGTPIKNATISINGETVQTDINGCCQTYYYNTSSPIEYSITARYYNILNNVIKRGNDTTYINAHMQEATPKSISFIICDSLTNEIIKNADITIDDTTITTNDLGYASIVNMFPQQIKCSIKKDNYISKDIVLLINSDTTITLKISTKPNIKIHVTGNNQNLADAIVTLDNSLTDTTDTNGNVCFNFVSVGKHIIDVIHYNYSRYIATIYSRLSDTDTTINLTELPSVKFAAYCDNAPLTNATITLNGEIRQTDNNGYAEFHHIIDGQTYNYTITGQNISDIQSSFYMPQNDTTINIIAESLRSSVIFDITNNNIPQAGINICVYGFTVQTDNNGLAIFNGIVHTSELPYEISDGYTFKIADTICIDNDTIRIGLDIAKIEFHTTFNITTSNGIPLNAVSITLNGSTAFTDENGFATFYRLKAGELMNYTIRKDGYTTTDGLSEISLSAICDENKFINIILVPTDTTSVAYNGTAPSIYPNPSNGTINIPNDFVGCNITIYDMRGSAVKSILATSNIIDLQPIKPGTYLMLTTTPNGPVSNLIVIK